MGLDTVELVMEIENEFDLSIPDCEASRMRTVGDVYDFLIRNRPDGIESSRCLTAAIFYELRRQLKSLGCDAGNISPRTEIRKLLPVKDRRVKWKQLAKASGFRLPSLRRSFRLKAVCSVGLLGFVVASWQLQQYSSIQSQILATFSATVLAATAIFCLTIPWAVHFDRESQTIRSLVESLAAKNYARLTSRFQAASQADIWYRLQTVVAEQLGVDRKYVQRQARFVEDLGAD